MVRRSATSLLLRALVHLGTRGVSCAASEPSQPSPTLTTTPRLCPAIAPTRPLQLRRLS